MLVSRNYRLRLILRDLLIQFFARLAVAFVRFPVCQLARLSAVSHLLAARALFKPRATAAGAGAVRLRLEVLHLRYGGPGCSGSINCSIAECRNLCVSSVPCEESDDLVVLTKGCHHESGAAVLIPMVYVGTKFRDEALNNV
jgi:hypothetical protein